MSERETFGVCHMCGAVPEETCRMMDSMGPCVRPPVSRAAGGETLADLYGSVPDLIPNPMTSEAWVRRYRDGFDAGYARALSSAPAPEERPDGWVAVWHWTCACEGVQHRASVPQCSVCMAHRPAASPSGAGSPVAHRWERCSECGPMVICGHCGNNCCNGGSGDNCPDRCASAYAEQKAGWARLNASKARHPAPPAAGREPSEALSDDEEREFVDAVGRECDVRRDVEAKLRKELAAMNLDPHALDEIGFEWVVQQAVRAGATFGLAEAERGLNVERVASLLYAFDEGHGGREPAKAWENVGTVWQDGWRKRARTLLRAALGASAQTNTGEG